jgi:hypothetical protein
VQDRLDDLLEDVELTDLVAGFRPQILDHLRVKRRAVRGDAADVPAALVQLPLELPQESVDVVLGRVVVEDAESQAVVAAVVHHREDAERAVIDLVDRQVAAEVRQGVLKVGARQAGPTFFSPAASTQFWMVA